MVVLGQKHPSLRLELNIRRLACSADPEIDSMARKVAELLEVAVLI